MCSKRICLTFGKCFDVGGMEDKSVLNFFYIIKTVPRPQRDSNSDRQIREANAGH